MARNNAWANHRLLNACAQLSDEEYRAKRASFFPSIELTLNHILSVDWDYLDGLDNGGRRWRELYALRDVPCASFEELRREQAAADRRLIRFCEQLVEDQLDAIVILNRPGGRYLERTQDVLAHLFQHDIHHRGQVHAMLAGTAVAPPQLDEFFLAQDAELRAGDLRALGLSER
ncbi:MAG: DinB family protein [Geminicoccaceae bacterium]